MSLLIFDIISNKSFASNAHKSILSIPVVPLIGCFLNQSSNIYLLSNAQSVEYVVVNNWSSELIFPVDVDVESAFKTISSISLKNCLAIQEEIHLRVSTIEKVFNLSLIQAVKISFFCVIVTFPVSGCLIGVQAYTDQVVHSLAHLTFPYSQAIGISATNGKSAH